MIEVEVLPARLALNEPTELSIRLSNTGPGTCAGIVLTLQLPVEIALLRGQRQYRISRLDERQSFTHEIQVQANQPGTWMLRSASLSYSDARGAVIQAPRLEVPIAVEEVGRPSAQREPEIEIDWQSANLVVNRWGGLSGRITNSSSFAIANVMISVATPMKCTPQTISEIPPGSSASFTLPVFPAEAGTAVPVRVQARCLAGAGQMKVLAVDGVARVADEPPAAGGTIIVSGDFIQSGAKKVGGDEISGGAQKGDRVEIHHGDSGGAVGNPRYCLHCGYFIRPESRFCEKCGQPVAS